jgi:hypothetical protein
MSNCAYIQHRRVSARFARARRFSCHLLTPVLLAGAMSACAARDPLADWQVRLAEYVDHQGGDPAALRNLADVRSRRAPRPGPIVFRTMDAGGSKLTPFRVPHDVHGVFLGISSIGGRPWCFFATATVRRSSKAAASVDDVRLTAFTADDFGFHWCVGPANPDSLARYKNANAAQDNDPLDAANAGTFPRLLDSFQLNILGETVFADEKNSGASWTMIVPTLPRGGDKP